MNFSLSLFLIIILILIPFQAFAKIDGIQAELLGQFEQPLRWDNIEGRPDWVCGVKPSYSRKKNMHLILLEPGEFVTVRIEPYAVLRVVSQVESFDFKKLELSISNGSGLYVFLSEHGPGPVSSQMSGDGQSILLSPESRIPLFARIKLPDEHDGSVALGLFTSRRGKLNPIAPYRDLLDLPLNSVYLREGKNINFRLFYILNAGIPVDVSIKGPQRIAIENRLLYSPDMYKRTQPYRIFIKTDGKLTNILECVAKPEMRKPVYDSGSLKVVGRKETVYVNIPDGDHGITLYSTDDLYIRPYIQALPDFYHHSRKFNEPNPNAASIYDSYFYTMKGVSFWDLTGAEIKEILKEKFVLPEVYEKLALRIIRDNRYQDGGLVGSMLLLEKSKLQPDYPLIQSRAAGLLGMHTAYRSLLPIAKSTPISQQFATFITHPLKEINTPQPFRIVARQHVDELLQMLPKTYFLDIGTKNLNSTTEYRLPKRFSDSYLRICVDIVSGKHSTFMLQFDDQYPIKFQVNQEPEFPKVSYDESLGEVGLTILNRQTTGNQVNIQRGAERLGFMSSLLKNVGSFEMFLPQKVRSVKIRRMDSKDTQSEFPLRVALQYRTAKPFLLSESEYHWMSGCIGEDRLYNLFLNFLKDYPRSISDSTSELISDEADFAGLELLNHWQPLIRLLNSQSKFFKASTQPCTSPKNQGPHFSPLMVENLSLEAVRFEKKNKWLAALEAWSKIFHHTQGEKKTNAHFSIVRCLQHLGEDYLAEQVLRECFWYVKDRTSHAASFAALELMYKQGENQDRLISLYASEILLDQSPGLLRKLCISLLDAGYDQEGLMLGQIIPESHRPVSHLLGATHRLSLWQTFDVLLKQLPDQKESYFWQGLWAANKGNYLKAGADWKKAGTAMAAMEYGNALEKGMEILTGLSSASSESHGQWIIKWENWQSRHPGPYVWKNANHLIDDYSGAHLLYSISRDLYFQTFKATPKKPVTLKLMGPIKIKLTARPLYDGEFPFPLNGWISVKKNDELHVIAVTRNLPASGLTVAEDSTLQVGNKIEYELDLGPGIHSLKINADHFPILTRIMMQRPAHGLNILPLLTFETCYAALKGGVGYFTNKKASYGVESQNLGNYDVLMQGAATLNQLRPKQDTVGPLTAEMLANNEIDAVLAFCSNQTERSVLYQMTLLTWIAEHFSERINEVIVQGEALYLEYKKKHIPGLSTLYNRLMQNQKWAPITSSFTSAGWRYLSIQGWQPESSYLRIRRALLGPVKSIDHVLYDHQQLILSTRFFRPTEIEIVLSKKEIACLPDFPMTVNVQVDENPVQTIVLLKDQAIQSVQKMIPSGEHFFKVWIAKKYENQFLHLNFFELRKDSIQESVGVIPLKAIKKRSYLVATQAEPLQIELEGPAWIRVEEYKFDRSHTSFQVVPPGWHRISFLPQPGQEEALFRIFQRISRPEMFKPEIRKLEAESISISAPLCQVKAREKNPDVRVKDGYYLGGQEDGTWSIAGGVRLRKNFLEDGGGENMEQYLELGAIHRYFWHSRRTYFRANILERTRQSGWPSFGFKGIMTRYPMHFPLNFKLGSQMYCQYQELAHDGSVEWSAKFDGKLFKQYEITPKIYHKPTFSIFSRYLSIKGFGAYNSQEVDQDVFSDYKQAHQTGIQISESLLYRPWLDMLWFCSSGLTSNEGYNFFPPDHFFVNAGWKQLLGSLELNADTRYMYYLNDDDRDDSYQRFILGFELIWQKWVANQHRFEFKSDLSYEFNSNDTSILFTITYHFGNGRAYRDFQPGEINFINLRKQRVPHKRNNRISYE